MKKVYIKPAIETVHMSTIDIMAKSLEVDAGKTGDQALGKDYDDYDDEGSVWNDD